MKPKTRVVWKFYSICEKEKSKCLLCDKTFSRKGRCTSGLIAHVKSKHKEEYLKMEETERSSMKTSSTSACTSLQAAKKQLTLQEALRKNTSWDVSHPKSVEIDKLIAEMIAVQDLPFNFVEGIGFRRLLESALPHYKLRGRDFFTKYVCEVMYAQLKKQVIQVLNTFDKLSLTTDIWSEPSAGVSLLSLTAHGISSEFERVNLILKCESKEGSHTGDVIQSTINCMINEWEIAGKIHCIVHEKGANMVRAMNLLNFTHVNCTVHQLQLCVHTGLNAEEQISELIAKNRKPASHFNHSILAQDKLKKIQTERLNQQPLGVVQDCPTRWNSTFYMMERLIKIKDSIVLYLTNHDKLSVSADDWKTMEKCVAILKPFEEITRELSSSNISISSVIPLIYILKSNLTHEKSKEIIPFFIKNVIERLMNEFNSRFSDLLQTAIFAISTYLNPRYKLKFFSESDKEFVRCEVLKLIISSCSETQTCNSPLKKKRKEISTSNTNPSVNVSSQIQKDIEIFLNESNSDFEEDTIETQCYGSLTYSEAKQLLAEYDKERKIHISEDPLLWWKRNCVKYKHLIPIVRQFLATPPGSVPSEQLFSGAGLIYDPLRTNLKSDKAAKLLFIKYNLAQLNFKY